MLSAEILEHALVFLSRADLKGAEVPAFVEVNNALQDALKTARIREAQHAPPATE